MNDIDLRYAIANVRWTKAQLRLMRRMLAGPVETEPGVARLVRYRMATVDASGLYSLTAVGREAAASVAG